jgi:predicted transcriptional regulator
MSSTMTIRLEDSVKNRLDQLASVTQRSKSFLAAEAQDYATDQDMADLALKWNTGAHAGRPNTLLAILP